MVTKCLAPGRLCNIRHQRIAFVKSLFTLVKPRFPFVNHIQAMILAEFKSQAGVRCPMLRRSFLLLLAAPLAACTTTRPVPREFTGALQGSYRLDSGDKLRITVFEQASLTGTYSVDQAGHVTMPLIGSVAARGATTQELAGRIAAALRGGFLRNPDVSVEVDTYRPFFIMGEVRNPGQYSYVNGMTGQTAIAIAGGYTARASERWVEVSRTINGQVVIGMIPVTEAIRPGDVLRIQQRFI